MKNNRSTILKIGAIFSKQIGAFISKLDNNRVTTTYTNSKGISTTKKHRRSFDTTKKRILKNIDKMKPGEKISLDRNGHFIYLDKNSTKNDIDLFLNSSNTNANEINKKKYSSFGKVKNKFNYYLQKKDIKVTYTNNFGQEKILATRPTTRYQTHIALKDKVRNLKPGQHISLDIDGKMIHLNSNSKNKSIKEFLNSSYPTNTQTFVNSKGLDSGIGAAAIVDQEPFKGPLTMIKKDTSRTTETTYKDASTVNKKDLEKEIQNLKTGQTLNIKANGKEMNLTSNSTMNDFEKFVSFDKMTDKDKKEFISKPFEKSSFKTVGAVLAAAIGTSYIANKMSDNFLLKAAAVGTITIATAYIANKYFTNQDFSFKDLVNKKSIGETFDKAKEFTNNPNLSPKDIQPDTWLKVNSDTALKYTKLNTPVIKEGNDYYVGLTTENMNEKTINSHIDLLSDKGIEKEMNMGKVAENSHIDLLSDKGIGKEMNMEKVSAKSMSDNFLLKASAVGTITIATAYISNKYFTNQDFSFKDLVNKKSIGESFDKAKEFTNNPNLSPKDIQPDSWFKVNRDTALKYNKKSTPVIKDGNDYYVGLKTGNMNEKTMNSHIDLLTDKGIGKEMNKEKVAAKSMAIA